MASSRYVSCIKIGGHPILPPLMSTHDKVELQKYKEDAIKKEEELSTRSQLSAMNDILSEADTQSNASCEEVDSRDSTVQTEQVMEFIRQALSDASHIEEVKMLQSAIFQELQKYTNTMMQNAESCDTLHNLNDISTNDGTFSPFSDLSPVKSDNSPPKELRELSEPLEQLSVPDERLSTPHFSQGSGSHHLNKMSTSDISPQSKSDSTLETPTKFIRRNSYTLESPSTSILAYLKSLNKDSEPMSSSYHSDSSPLLKEKTVARNLSEHFKETVFDKKNSQLLSNSCVELNYSSSPPKSNHKLDGNYNFDEKQDAMNDIRKKTSNLSLTCSKKRLFENNNVTPEIERAATIIQAGIRGYLTRRLMRTYKVIELKNTIKDSLITALQLHTEPAVNKAEVELHKRLALQVESVCSEWHSIFFELPPSEKMKIIQIDRNRAMLAKKPRPPIKKTIKSRLRTGYESADSIASSTTSSYSKLGKSKNLLKEIQEGIHL